MFEWGTLEESSSDERSMLEVEGTCGFLLEDGIEFLVVVDVLREKLEGCLLWFEDALYGLGVEHEELVC